MNNAQRVLTVLLFASTYLFSQPAILPLSDVQPGMKGTGRTVFSGKSIEEFGVEVLGVVRNQAPGQSIILARLSGGPLEKTGVIQGMSGSPVYIGGKLIGAVALGFVLSKEPICGIRPIEEMLAVKPGGEARAAGPPPRVEPGPERLRLADGRVEQVFPAGESVAVGGARLQAIQTPLQLSGFSAGTLEHFAPVARELGLSLGQGFSGSGAGQQAEGPAGTKPVAPEPGSMISVQLMRGDMQVAADGTVTHVDGEQIYAFGHRFLAIGGTELPFARSEVITVLPNLSSSFKISSAGEPLGVIRQDRNAAISGVLGQQPVMAPLEIRVLRERPGGQRVLDRQYRMDMVRDPYLVPLLLQMALFSAVDSTERTVGASSIGVDATLRFGRTLPPMRVRNQFSGTSMVALSAALSVSVPVGYALQAGFDALTLDAAEIEVVSYEEQRALTLEQLWASTQEVAPGEEVEVHAVLLAENGEEVRQNFRYRVPQGMPEGPLFFSAADAASLNLLDYPKLSSVNPSSAEQVVAIVNGLRPNNRLYLRVWRQEPTYAIQGVDLPAPPPSAALILDKSTDVKGGKQAARNAALEEMSAGFGNYAVSGSKTIRVDVKAN